MARPPPRQLSFDLRRGQAAGGLAWRGLRGMSRLALDAVLPPGCAMCAARVAQPGQVCAACFAGLQLIAAPFCDSCGLPLAPAPRRGPASCAACEAKPPLWRSARAALLYNDAARRLLLPLKHAGREENAAVLAPHMLRAAHDILGQADFLVPVPLHRDRRIARRYNQSALLAHALARRSGVAVLPDALRRVVATPPLGGASAQQRADLLRGAMAPHPRRQAALAGARLILVDDVMTSGATAAACASCLLDAGAAHVDVLVAARVADPRG